MPMPALTTRTTLAPEMETPPHLFDALWEEYGGFDFDPCCLPDQYTAQRVLDNGGTICIPSTATLWKDEYKQPVFRDGLAQPWYGKVYMNPPYDRTLAQWVEKAVTEVLGEG